MTNISLTVFTISLAASMLSALFLLIPQIPAHYVRVHSLIITLPVGSALLGLMTTDANLILGPLRLDPLAWLMALFVLTIGLVVQRYSIRYMYGDRSYRAYFFLLTLTTSAASFAWLSDDVRLLLFSWGLTLTGLTLLFRLNKEWNGVRIAASISFRMFALSWLALLIAAAWISQMTGHWQLSLALTNDGLSQLNAWDRHGISFLLILAVIIPAAQFPFQRWLLASAVVPTPVSAVMHAGLVNVGGILLARFAPLFSGSFAPVLLLIISSISVLIGTGIILVHVDYKRQLVGSTIAQMGFMLIQCALGAYLAAIIHLILHGLFKAALFLQAGSAIHQKELSTAKKNRGSSAVWTIAGVMLGFIAGFAFWFMAPDEGYRIISAIILGWSLSFTWTQLIAFGHRPFAGFSLLIGVILILVIIHALFSGLLHDTVHHSAEPPIQAVVVVLVILLAGSSSAVWLSRHRKSAVYMRLYVWLVQWGEAPAETVESHPSYLVRRLSRGGNQR